jgi:mutator protein MutT
MPKLFYIGIKAIIVNNDQVLLLKSQHAGTQKYFWDFPGGRIEHGETIMEALQRELLEELPGIECIEVKRFVSLRQLETDLPDGNGLVLLLYEVAAKVPRVLQLSSEHCGYSWVDIHELSSIGHEAEMHPDYTKILQTVTGHVPYRQEI